MAGMILFVTLGLSLAIALAVIDDRLYRRVDLEQLGVAVLAVIPPAVLIKRKRDPAARRQRTAKQKVIGNAIAPDLSSGPGHAGRPPSQGGAAPGPAGRRGPT
jgi:hypothetical protein